MVRKCFCFACIANSLEAKQIRTQNPQAFNWYTLRRNICVSWLWLTVLDINEGVLAIVCRFCKSSKTCVGVLCYFNYSGHVQLFWEMGHGYLENLTLSIPTEEGLNNKISITWASMFWCQYLRHKQLRQLDIVYFLCSCSSGGRPAAAAIPCVS